MVPMRIVSLLPSATEIVYALGLGDDLVGVTFECDEPPVRPDDKAVVVGGRDTRGMAPGEIDEYVKAQLAAGADLYTLHADALAGLDPELILTQDLCRVCALPTRTMSPTRSTTWAAGRCALARPVHVWRTCWVRSSRSVGHDGRARARRGPAGRGLVRGWRRSPRRSRADPEAPRRRRGVGRPAVHRRTLGARPRGGGRRRAGRRPSRCEVDSRPPGRIRRRRARCGRRLAVRLPPRRRRQHARTVAARLPAAPVWAIDADGIVVRPGPRLVDGVEAIAAILHPDSGVTVPSGRVRRIA